MSPDVQPFVGLAATLAGPDLVASPEISEWPLGNLAACSAQRVSPAGWAGLARGFARQLAGAFERCNTPFQRFHLSGHFFQGFPYRDLIKDFQYV